MAGLGAALGKQVGPMPLGAWLVVGAGGLFIAYKSRQDDGDAPAATGDPLPTGGGYGPSGGAVGSWDGAAVVLSPIFQLPTTRVVVNIPKQTPGNSGPIALPIPTPRVPSPVKTRPPVRQVVTYTVKRGDTLWGIAAKHLGSGMRQGSIYSQNKAAIEAAARKNGRRSSRGPSGLGHWIYPGTVLRFNK